MSCVRLLLNELECCQLSGARPIDSVMAPFSDLDAFKASYELGLAVFRSTEHWPKREMFGMSAQIRRAAISISANVAEGAAKKGEKEFRRYLDISLGSLAEVQVMLRFAKDLQFVSHQEADDLEALRAVAGRLRRRLYQAISARLSPS